jgi:hypothetical protein
MHTPTPAQARTELARRGRNDLGRKAFAPNGSRQARTQAQKARTFEMATKDLVLLAQAEVPTPAPVRARKARKTQAVRPTNAFVVTADELARMFPQPEAQVEVPGSIVLRNSSARTLACIG